MLWPGLQSSGYPGSFGIICEKVAVEGITRFEDRYRLPVGISVNMTSFAAKLLTQARAHGLSACDLEDHQRCARSAA